MSRLERVRKALDNPFRRGTEAAKGRDWTPLLGLALAVTCAVFPWYIFLNQERFGIAAMNFNSGGGFGQGASRDGGALPSETASLAEELSETLDLDPFPTGTAVPVDPGHSSAETQPFPEPAASYRMVYATLGRAMIADDEGLFVVQAGSKLPDASLVKSIEQRDGAWVLITSKDKVLPLQP